MKDYIIMTDSCCDLPSEYIKNNNIPYVRLTCSFKGKEYLDDFGQSLSYKEFYEGMRQGEIPKTSQPSPDAFYKIFEKYIKQDKDILYVCVSSGLSGTYNSANIAKNMILDEYINAKIEIVDILTASLGQGLAVDVALNMKEKGSTIDEIVEFLNNNKLKLNTYITVDDLEYLKNGGRISTAAALVGKMLNIKPILTLNDEGRVIVIRKAKGRKAVISKLAEFVIEKIENPEESVVCICHGECIEDAEKLKQKILKSINVKEIIINYVGPVVGTYGGPGALAVFFMGKHRQNHIIDI
ncbi:DegV family protein [Clostridium niameyense]|uniref:DegV family protein n=1 Tax=Clostridium niameyense TaxID=1622073 RepID=A0A6M0RA77_9CLOT|nr:DegV family protein [Clostridium niameyense]NEZ46570.1 DegV family protein [Clostridium niameyense]